MPSLPAPLGAALWICQMQRLPGRVLARLATPDGLAAWRPAAVAAGRLCLASLSQQLGAALAPPQPPERPAARALDTLQPLPTTLLSAARPASRLTAAVVVQLAAPTVEFCTLVTRPGDSLSEVARITRTPVHVLQSVNNLGGAAPLQVLAGRTRLAPIASLLVCQERFKRQGLLPDTCALLSAHWGHQAGQALLVPRSRTAALCLPVVDRPEVADNVRARTGLRQDRQSSGIAAEDGGKLVIANWGDSLWSLAERHNISIDDLRRSNGLPEPVPQPVPTPWWSAESGQEGCRWRRRWSGHFLVPMLIAGLTALQGSSHLQLGQEVLIPSARALAAPQPALGMAGLLQRWTDELPPVQFLLRPEALQGYPLLAALSSSALVSVMPKWRPEPFGLPVHGGWLSSYYGWKDKRWYFHNGIDIAVEEGTPVTAASSGLVTYSDWKGGYGKTVCIDHGNGLSTLYAHCSDLAVRPGQFVRKGQAVARSGNTGHSTGPHLHFEIHRGGKTVDPLEEIPAICYTPHAVSYDIHQLLPVLMWEDQQTVPVFAQMQTQT
eukprot:SM000107S14072  [mRNA]  locus=s107:458584:462362:+ [translate_table: standard]